MGRIVKRIVLVEPEGVLAEVTAFRLELLGYHVEIVRNAEDGVRVVTTTQPDLVITDLELERTSAIGLIECLASQAETNDVPILVMSMDADLDRVTAVYKAGAADFLVVPFQPEVLQEKVAKLLLIPRRHVDERVVAD